jgi:hypothetical protein
MRIEQISGKDVFAYNCEEATVASAHDREKNISDILEAIDTLISLNGIDVARIRLHMDTLFRMWEGRYYSDFSLNSGNPSTVENLDIFHSAV